MLRVPLSDAVRTVLRETMPEEASEADLSAKWLRKIGEKMWSSQISRSFMKDAIKRFEIEKDISDFTMAFENIRDLKDLAKNLDTHLTNARIDRAIERYVFGNIYICKTPK